MEADRLERIAAVHRDLAAISATAQLTPRANRGHRPGSAVSSVFSVRLDRDEIDALYRQADVRGLKPSVLARNLIRIGLTNGGASVTTGDPNAMTGVIDRLEDTLAELRALAS